MTGRRARRRRPVLVAAGALVAALVLVELVLQAGAWIVWSRRQEPREPGEGTVVLCTGDSFTFGLGASDPAQQSWPRQLERLLRAGGDGSWSVVNDGYPGRSSADVLRELPAQLRRHRPQVVCVLVGVNDFWKQPALVEAPAAEAARGGFELVWRTGRLLRIAAEWWRGGGFGAAPAGDPPFVGLWHAGDVEVAFERGGRLVTGGTELRWIVEGGRLLVLLPPLQNEIEVAWHRDGDRLALRSELAALSLDLAAGPAPDRSPLHEGRAALRAGDAAAAVRAFTRCLREGRDEVEAREGLVSAWGAQQRPDRAAEHLAWLERRAHEHPGRAVAEALAQARAAAGQTEAAVAAAAEAVRRWPDSRRAWEVLMAHGMQPAHRATVRAVVDDALAVVPRAPGLHADLLRLRALLQRDEDPAASLQSHFEAVLVDGGEAVAKRHLFLDRALYGEDVLEQCLRRMTLDQGQEQRLRQLYRAAMAGEAGVVAVLEAHLRALVALCRQAGAEPLLLGYPFAQPAHERLVEGLAAEEGVANVAMWPAFAKLLETRPREELFVADGHCTDAGYAVMAELVAEQLRK